MINNMKNSWQHRIIIITLIVPCLLAFAAAEFNNCRIDGSPHIITAIDNQNYALQPINSSEFDTLYRNTNGKSNRGTSPGFEKPLFFKPYQGLHKYFHPTFYGAGLLASIHRKSSQQFCRLTDIPPPFYISL